MSEMGKPFLKKFWQKEQKKPENYCKNATCEQKTTSEKWKSGSKKTRPRINYEWIGKTIYKKHPIQKIEKSVKKSKWNCRMWTENH